MRRTRTRGRGADQRGRPEGGCGGTGDGGRSAIHRRAIGNLVLRRPYRGRQDPDGHSAVMTVVPCVVPWFVRSFGTGDAAASARLRAPSPTPPVGGAVVVVGGLVGGVVVGGGVVTGGAVVGGAVAGGDLVTGGAVGEVGRRGASGR